MEISISRPDLLMIADGETTHPSFGGNQSWYSSEWSRKAGCGPTCAANILAYLSLSRPELLPLYGHEKMDRSDFSKHMEEVYEFVTPGSMGLNRVELFSDGVAGFARDRGILLEPHVFRVSCHMTKDRPNVSELMEFVKDGLASNSPVGFLNLSRGKVKNLQSWHWITIAAADIDRDRMIVTVSDEGQQLSLDLRLWYLTTRMRGGLAYFTYPSPSAPQAD